MHTTAGFGNRIMSAGIAAALVVGGLVLLVLGAEGLVRGAASLGKRLAVAEIVIGLTIVAFGTSAPEMAVNVMASIQSRNDIVFGNIIGSNIFNLLFILGVAGLIYPLTVQQNTVWKEIPFSLLVTLALLFLVNDAWGGADLVDRLSRNDGFVLLLLLAIFIVYVLGISKTEPDGDYHVKQYSIAASVLLIAVGLVVLVVAAQMCVGGAVALAQRLGLSEKFIACTILAAGTSLPELATSTVAAYRRHCDIAVGNVIGSNIFNILAILGVSAVIRPAQYATSFNVDTILLAVATLLLFVAMFTGGKRRLDRWEAAILLLGYAGYTVYLLRLR
jgi:cation:H+ antiporter